MCCKGNSFLCSREKGLLLHGEITLFSFSDFIWTREDQGVREVLPHIGPIPIKIPLKLFLEGIDFLTDNVTSRVAWKLRGGGKVQKHVGISL